jgi:hypothetical protein
MRDTCWRISPLAMRCVRQLAEEGAASLGGGVEGVAAGALGLDLGLSLGGELGGDDAGLGPRVPRGIGTDGDDLAGGVDAGGVAGLRGVGLLVDAGEEGDRSGLVAIPGAVGPVEHGHSLRAKFLRCLLGGGLGFLLAQLLSHRSLDAAVVPGLATASRLYWV